jgi:hypothetical protein
MEPMMSPTSFGPAPQIASNIAPRVTPITSNDRLFIRLLNGYRSSGGLQRLTTLQATRRQAWGAEVTETLPLGVAERRVLGIAWNQEVWAPDFQFEAGGAIKPAAAAVFRELVPCHDPWDLAAWFITPSPWLDDDRPAELLAFAPERVVEVARADRYVATGG